METKRCDRCSLDLSPSAFSKHKGARDGLQGICKPCRNAARNRLHATKRETINMQQRVRRERLSGPDREEARARANAWYQANAERAKAKTKATRETLKAEMVAAYGGACSCCGERNLGFLTLDHVNNDGADHRRELGHSHAVWRYLRDAGWPKAGYTVLCYNCNCGRARNGGVCPHITASGIVCDEVNLSSSSPNESHPGRR